MSEMTRDYVEVVLRGLGGQGILTIARHLAEVGSRVYKYVSYFPNYSMAMRGEISEATVILSQEEVKAPAILEPELAIVMSQEAFDELEGRVKPQGWIFLDSSIINQKSSKADLRIMDIPASERALELGSSEVANFILLGAFLEVTKALPLEMVERVLGERMAGGRREYLIDINKRALREGERMVREG